MRTARALLVMLASAFLFTACPVSTVYPLAKQGAAKRDNALIGNWNCEVEDAEAKQIAIKAGSDANTYRVTVTERGSMFMADSDEFNGWIAELGGMRFLVLQEIVEGTAKETYYVYQYELKNNNLISHDITLKVGGADAVVSTAAYQAEVLASMKQEGFLASETIWTKIKN